MTFGRRLTLRWQPVSDGVSFATFEGWLDFMPLTGRVAEVSLSGPYELPSQATDSTALAAVTQRTALRIVRAVAAELARLTEGLVVDDEPEHGAVLRVRDLATPDPLILDEQLPLRTAALLLLHYQVGGAPVVDHGRLVGVLTESDLLAREAALRIRGGWAAREEHRRRQALTVGEACSRPAVTVSPHTTVREAARLLLDQDVSRLIVVSDHQAVGVLTRRDVLRTLIRSQHELQRLVDSRVAATAVEGVRAEVTEGGHVVVTGHARLRSELEALLRALAPIDGVVEARVQADWDVDDLERRWTETVHP